MSNQDPSDSLRIAWADSDADILACLPVMRELRAYIGDQGDFVAHVRLLQQNGYRLVAVWSGDRVVACAGYNIMENLIRGRYLHVEELITMRSERSKGIGQRLLEALIQEACDLNCQALTLECGLRNSLAHRFYFREGLRISAFRFVVAFDAPSGSD